jgi:hypothetical protein
MAALDAKTQLEILDTFHDFCTKERKRAGDDEEDTDESNLEFSRSYVANFLRKQFPAQLGALTGDVNALQNAIINSITNSNVRTISKIEDNTVDYFETTFSNQLNSDKGKRKIITYETIIEGYTNGENSPLWQEFRNNRSANSILEIQRGTKSIGQYKGSQQNIIANFILNYFFGTSQGDIRLTFDAKTGIVGKVFNDIDQVYNLIFPQTISDSATTSFTGLRGRNEFFFPSKTDTDTITSALYSRGKYDSLEFKNNNFGDKNPYGFSIVVRRRDGNTLTLPFSSSQTEGPSVNYLIDILKAAKANPPLNFSTIKKKNQILSVGKYLDLPASSGFKRELVKDIRQDNDGLLLDLKRSGDHEAALAVPKASKLKYPLLIFSTIDKLCALKSRDVNNNTIYHHDEDMILYRNEASIDPARIQQIKKEEYIYRIKDLLSKFKILETLSNKYRAQLTALKTEAVVGKGAFFSGKTPSSEDEQKARKIVTALQRYKMDDLEEFFRLKTADGAETPFTPENIASLTNCSTILTNIIRVQSKWVFENIEGKNKFRTQDRRYIIDNHVEECETFLVTFEKEIKTTLGLDVSPTIVLVSQPRARERPLPQARQQNLYTVANKLEFEKKFSENSIFLQIQNSAIQYNSSPYSKLYENLVALSKAYTAERVRGGGILPNPPSRQYTFFMKETLKIVENYALEILDQFVTDAHKGLLSNFLLFKSLTPEQYPEIVNQFFEANSLPDFAKPASIVLPVGGAQVGGADAQQYYECADLLYEISAKAAAFIESAYSTVYPIHAFLVSATEVQTIAYYMNKRYNEYRNPASTPAVKQAAIKYLCMRGLLVSKVKSTVQKAHAIVASRTAQGFDELLRQIKESEERLEVLIKDENTNPAIVDLIQGIHENCLEIVQRLNLCVGEFPSLQELYTKIYNNQEYKDAADELRDEMQRTWEYGLETLKLSPDYRFEEEQTSRGLSTDELITFLLSLQVNSEKSAQDGVACTIQTNSVDSILYNTELASNPRKTTAIEIFKRKMTYYPDPTNSYEVNVSIPILMVFTLLENLQNPNKYSFFLKPGYQNIYFNSQKDWTNVLYHRIDFFIESINQRFTLNGLLPTLTIRGGKYPLQTRRHHKKKSRMTRRKQ